MPTNRSYIRRPHRSRLSHAQEMDLWLGAGPLYDPQPFASAEARRAAWLRHRDCLLRRLPQAPGGAQRAGGRTRRRSAGPDTTVSRARSTWPDCSATRRKSSSRRNGVDTSSGRKCRASRSAAGPASTPMAPPPDARHIAGPISRVSWSNDGPLAVSTLLRLFKRSSTAAGAKKNPAPARSRNRRGAKVEKSNRRRYSNSKDAPMCSNCPAGRRSGGHCQPVTQS